MRLGALRAPRPATLVERAAAYIADALITLVIWLVLILAIARGRIDALLEDSQLLLAASMLYLVIPFVYFVVGEALVATTPGKRLVGLRVVDQRFQAPGLYPAIVRNVLRLTWALGPLGPLFLAADAVLIQLGEDDERLGDMAAATRVVRLGPARLALPG